MELFYDLVSKFELIKQFGVLTKTVKDNVRCEDIIHDLGRLDEKFPSGTIQQKKDLTKEN